MPDWHHRIGCFPKVKRGKSKYFIFISSSTNYPGQSLTKTPFIAFGPLVGSCKRSDASLPDFFLLESDRGCGLRFSAAWHEILSCDTAAKREYVSSSHVCRKSKKANKQVKGGLTAGRGPNSVVTFPLLLRALKSGICLHRSACRASGVLLSVMAQCITVKPFSCTYKRHLCKF